VSDASGPPTTGLRARLARWRRLRGRSALVVVGALASDAARSFAARVAGGQALPIPVDAGSPARADVLVIVGRVTPKLASALSAARRQMGPDAVVLAFDEDDDDHHAAARADAVVDVDVLVRGIPPDEAALQRALDALEGRGGPARHDEPDRSIPPTMHPRPSSTPPPIDDGGDDHGARRREGGGVGAP
jgi:hypothetical protein